MGRGGRQKKEMPGKRERKRDSNSVGRRGESCWKQKDIDLNTLPMKEFTRIWARFAMFIS